MKKEVFDRVAHFYDQEQKNFKHDIPFYLKYAKRCRGEVLELACGTGRVLIPVARAGAKITGLDVSTEMLGVAETKVKRLDRSVRKRIALVRGDMASFELKKRFDLVIIAFRSFQCLLDKKAQGACLACVNRHLKKNGLLILDLFAPRHEYLAPGRVELDMGGFYDPNRKARIKRRAETVYDLAKQTLVCDMTYEWKDRHGGRRRHVWTFELGYLFRYETELLLEKYGFEVVKVFGDFNGSPYNYHSGEQIFLARKA